MRLRISGICVLFLTLFLLQSVAWSQVSTSRVEGTILDKTGAVVPHAAVKVTNEATGVSYGATTTNSGTYAVPSLTPGQYTVTVSSQGFETFKSEHNVLTVGAPLVVDAKLNVGTQSQTIEDQTSYHRIETNT